MRTAASFLIAVLGLMTLLASGVFDVVHISGPSLVVGRHGAQVTVEPQFLEYNLGIDRLLIEDVAAAQVILEAASKAREVMSQVQLEPGPLNLASMLGPNAETPLSSPVPAVLVHGRQYRITIWGNNGFGHITSASTVVVL